MTSWPRQQRGHSNADCISKALLWATSINSSAHASDSAGHSMTECIRFEVHSLMRNAHRLRMRRYHVLVYNYTHPYTFWRMWAIYRSLTGKLENKAAKRIKAMAAIIEKVSSRHWSSLLPGISEGIRVATSACHVINVWQSQLVGFCCQRSFIVACNKRYAVDGCEVNKLIWLTFVEFLWPAPFATAFVKARNVAYTRRYLFDGGEVELGRGLYIPYIRWRWIK